MTHSFLKILRKKSFKIKHIVDTNWLEMDCDWWAAYYEDLTIIMDEMHEVFYALMKCK